ncbi:MAG TPA: hypothetical protein VGU25_16615 [Acidobacteriaceae bacterium]|nr:hypothetical protein [Acidobacteriaceae bacterium]
MRRKNAQLSFSKLAAVWFSALTVVTAVVAIAAASGWFVATVTAGGSPMAGNWVGMCQDGRPFVELRLEPAVRGYGGTISLGNVKITSQPGAAEGSCTVNDPPSAEHAMKVAKAWMVGDTLTFDSDRGQEYEMKMTGRDAAKLRFVATNQDESWFGLRRVK